MKILIPLDGSTVGGRGLPYATALARATDGQVILHHVVTWDEARHGQTIDIESLASGLRASGIEVAVRVSYLHYFRSVAASICSVAREEAADLIVMSTHGRGGLGRALYGSVADEVFRTAELPVLVIPAGIEGGWSTEGMRRTLVPLDGSEFSEEALPVAQRLSRQFDADLYLLQVIGPPVYALHERAPRLFPFAPDEEIAEAQQYLEKVATRLREFGSRVHVVTSTGFPSNAIERVTRAEKIDLIVMATHGRGGLSRVGLGSVTAGMLRRAHAPLLLVRPEAVRQAGAAASIPAAEPAGVPMHLELSPEEVGLLEIGLQNLLHSTWSGIHITDPVHDLLTKLREARSTDARADIPAARPD